MRERECAMCVCVHEIFSCSSIDIDANKVCSAHASASMRMGMRGYMVDTLVQNDMLHVAVGERSLK